MRFEPLSDRAQMILLSPIIVPVCAAAFVAFVIAAPIVYPWMTFSRWLDRKRRERGWHSWFAWHPVMALGYYYDRPDKLVWLERIGRQWVGGWSYRFPGELNTWERRDAAQAIEAGTGETERLDPQGESAVHAPEGDQP